VSTIAAAPAARRHELARWCAAGAVVFIVLFWRLGGASFWDPDEAHYAQTTREMIERGDWVAPFYNEEPFFDKPVLFHQLQGAAMVVLGQNEFAARFVPALAALALIAATAWLGATLVSADAGMFAALFMATSPGLFALARYAILDTLFTAFLFGGASLVTVAALRNRPALQYPGYLLVALAVLTKGPLALVICGLAFVLAVVASPDLRRRLLGLHWILGLTLVCVIAAPWFVMMYMRFGDRFIAGYLFDENLSLYGTNRFGDQPGYSFYFRILAVGLLPWTGLVVGRLIDDVRAAWTRRAMPGPLEILLWAWTAAVVGFFTFSRFKLDHYVFPVAPAIAILCARAWTDVREQPDAPEHRGARIGVQLVGPFLILLGMAVGYYQVTRLNLPPIAVAVPVALTCAGLAIVTRGRATAESTLPRLPWLAVSAIVATYVGVVLWVIPALETQKVVPDVARWVASHAQQTDRVASYRLNRWNTAFRFYVDRHTTLLDAPDDASAFFAKDQPFYCVMLEPAYREFVARGVPLTVVHQRDGMWVTSGRALWRGSSPNTRFVVVTRAGQTSGPES
jgi:4-amino-4-deoxy-L-arabinose transferase-like glycosyltransferase